MLSSHSDNQVTFGGRKGGYSVPLQESSSLALAWMLVTACLAASLTFSLSQPAFAANQTDAVKVLRAGDFIRAKQLLLSELQQLESAGTHSNLGIALLRLHDYSGALDHLARAVQLEPNLAVAWLNLAACYLCLNEPGQAIDAYQRVQTLQPMSAPSLKELINFLDEARQIDESAPDYFNATWRKWAPASTIRAYIAQPANMPGYRPQFAGMARESLRQVIAVCNQSNGKLKLEFVSEPANANLICNWIAPPSNATTIERGIATAEARNAKITRANVTIFLNPEAGLSCLTDETVRKSLLHEFMHAVGVRSHSTNVQDIMFALVELPTVEAQLSPRDRATLKKLYE